MANVGYRDKQEVDYWIENKDPIKLYLNKLLEENVITSDEVEDIYAEEKKHIENAIEFAETSPFPSKDDAYRNVFS